MQRTLKLIDSLHDIPYLNGKTSIAASKRIFRGHLDSNFYHWRIGHRGKSSKQTALDMHQLAQTAGPKRIFLAVSSDLAQVCLTQHQVVHYCEFHQDLLNRSAITLVLLKKDERKEPSSDNLIVGSIQIYPEGIAIFPYRFGDRHLSWQPADDVRILTPHLPPALTELRRSEFV